MKVEKMYNYQHFLNETYGAKPRIKHLSVLIFINEICTYLLKQRYAETETHS